MNALKHGLAAKTVVIRGEDPREFEAMRSALVRDFAPKTTYAELLVDRLAANFWRLRRIPIFEAAIIEYQCLDLDKYDAWDIIGDFVDSHLEDEKRSNNPVIPAEDYTDEVAEAEQTYAIAAEAQKRPAAVLARMFIKISSDSEILDKLSKYEVGLVKQVEAGVAQLEREAARLDNVLTIAANVIGNVIELRHDENET